MVLKKEAWVLTTTLSFSLIIVLPIISLTKYSISTLNDSMLCRLNNLISIVSLLPCNIFSAFMSLEIGFKFISKSTFLLSISIIVGTDFS